MSRDAPPPGSPEAVAMGCLCAREDNGHGRGAMGGAVRDSNDRPLYWVTAECPVHTDEGGEGDGSVAE